MKRRAELRTDQPQAIRYAGEDQVPISWEQIEAYLNSIKARNYSLDTVRNYRRSLKQFYHTLPPDKLVDRGSAASWRRTLQEQGLQVRTVNQKLTAINSFFDYLGLRAFQLPSALALPDDTQPELTRNEYLRLLSAARVQGKERTYLLVKVFAAGGLTLGELPGLTAEGVEENRLVLTSNGVKRFSRLPECLRQELLAYMRRMGIRSGPVFTSRNGKQIYRSTVTSLIQGLAQDARVEPEKCTPRCLRKLYQMTQENIWQNIALLAEQAHERLLEQEQLTIGWEEMNDDAADCIT